MWWIMSLVLCALIFAFGIYYIFYYVFRRNGSQVLDDRSLPEGEQYEPHNAGILKAIENLLPVPYEEVWTNSYDGLKLYGKYYEFKEGAPLLLFFHGYRSSSIKDGNGIFGLCQRQGWNILMVDQRSHGKSQGKVITFGVRERKDVLTWLEFAVSRCGSEVPMVLAGISMGAATVMMASDLDLPANVKGIVADCGYSSPKDILCCVMATLKMPPAIFYPLARFSAKLFGNLDIEEASAKEAVKNSRVPILFIHGDDDRFVPCSMSQVCYDACGTEKRLVFVKDAGHGISYCVDAKLYEQQVIDFVTSSIAAKS